MPEENGNTEEQNKGESGAGDKFTPITSQEQLNRIIGGRIDSVKSQFADYDELKAKAEKFDQAETEKLSEIEKAVKRAEAAEAKVASFEAEKQRTGWAKEIVKDSGVPVEALRGNTREELEEHFKVLSSLVSASPTGRRTATPPGKPAAGDGEKGRAAAALRELRQG